jgi:hypothetical protein
MTYAMVLDFRWFFNTKVIGFRGDVYGTAEIIYQFCEAMSSFLVKTQEIPSNGQILELLIFGFLGLIDTADTDFGNFRNATSASSKPFAKRIWKVTQRPRWG